MGLSPKRISLIFGFSLVFLWVTLAAWMLSYYSHRFSAQRREEKRPTTVPKLSPPEAIPISPIVKATPRTAPAKPQECTSFFNIPGLRFYSWVAQPGETFALMAARTKLKEETLRSLNQSNSRKVEIQPDDLVLLPSKDGVFHMVREGQGLSDIARAYVVPLKEVLSANRKAADADLKPGEILCLPHGRFLWDTDSAWILLNALAKTAGFIRPIAARFADAYGQRMHPVLQKEAFHGGLDLAAGMGTPVMAAQDGRVIFEGPRGTYGNTVILDHGMGLTSWYGHLSQTLARQGQSVKRGDVIGKVGRTGRATGPHLHFEVRKNNQPQNPLLYLGK
jgi:murein DD-endopeptidase MepM/ murein hydrolase activator NlpD